MDDSLVNTHLDALVAAILTSPRIAQSMTGAQSVREFKATLKALAKEGNAEGLVVAARAAILAAAAAGPAAAISAQTAANSED